MKKFLLSLSAAVVLLGAPTAQAAFVPHPTEIAASTPETASITSVTSYATVEAPVASEKVIKAEKLSFFGKLKRYFRGDKKQIVAIILSILLGSLGIHRFYMGYTGIGLAQLGLTLVGNGLYIAGAISTAMAVTAAAAGTTVAISPLVFIGAGLIAAAAIWNVIDFVRLLIGNLQPKDGYFD